MKIYQALCGKTKMCTEPPQNLPWQFLSAESCMSIRLYDQRSHSGMLSTGTQWLWRPAQKGWHGAIMPKTALPALEFIWTGQAKRFCKYEMPESLCQAWSFADFRCSEGLMRYIERTIYLFLNKTRWASSGSARRSDILETTDSENAGK